jgi:hypothetical protein
MKPYFSLSTEETALLKRTRGDECRLYIALRERADFKTGRLDHPSARHLTSASLARELSLPASQGMPALILERKDISRGIERLQTQGLVDEVERQGHAIRLRLPLVARSTCNAQPAQNKLSQREAEPAPKMSRFPGDAAPTENLEEWAASQSAAEYETPRLSQPPAKPRARLPQTHSGHSVETPAGLGFSGFSDGALNTEKQILSTPITPPKAGKVIPPSAAKTKTHHAPSALANEPEKTKPESAAAAAFEAIIAGQRQILYPRSPTSRSLYLIWAEMAVSPEEVQAAIADAISDTRRPPTPNRVDAAIRVRRMPSPTSIPRARRGKGDLVL